METIGLCEGKCGRVDHHLVDGLCADCRKDVITIDASGAEEMACDDTYQASLIAQQHREAMNIKAHSLLFDDEEPHIYKGTPSWTLGKMAV